MIMKKDKTGQIICPQCHRHYTPELGERKTNLLIQIEFPNALPYQREQLITGICSDECWDKYLGIDKHWMLDGPEGKEL